MKKTNKPDPVHPTEEEGKEWKKPKIYKLETIETASGFANNPDLNNTAS